MKAVSAPIVSVPPSTWLPPTIRTITMASPLISSTEGARTELSRIEWVVRS